MAGSNSPFSSGGSVSSLVKSAQTQAQKIQDYNDALVDYEWQNSTKTYADWLSYNQYLQTQSNNNTDPMAALKYVKKQDTARSAYISNEIQRQSIDVIEGNITSTEKYGRMADLYYEATSAGQYDLAQGLRLQLDNLSVTIQNEAKAAISANKEMARELAKQIDDQVKDATDQIKSNASTVVDMYTRLGADEFENQFGADLFSTLSNMVNSTDPNNPGLVQVLDQAMQASPDPAKVRQYQQSFNAIAEGEGLGQMFNLPGVGNITYKDLQDQAYAYSIGQSLFSEKRTGEGVEFVKKKVTGYEWGRDENGNQTLMPIYNEQADLTSKVANKDKKDSNFSYGQLLGNAGFDVVSGKDADSQELIVRNNGEFDKAGIPRGQQVQLYVDQSGKLQVINGDRAYNLDFDQASGKYTGIRANDPNAFALLPSGDERYSRFNNRFFATQDLSGLASGAIALIDTTSPAARSMQGTGLLSRPQAQVQGVSTGAPLPAAPNVAQQGAVNPMSLPANTQINIARPQPLPTIKLAQPKPLPNLTVTQAKPQKGGLSVGPSRPNPRITF